MKISYMMKSEQDRRSEVDRQAIHKIQESGGYEK